MDKTLVNVSLQSKITRHTKKQATEAHSRRTNSRYALLHLTRHFQAHTEDLQTLPRTSRGML